MFFILMTSRQKIYRRRLYILCSRVMLIPNYFARRQTKDTCLYPLLPKQRPKKLLFSLKSRGHSYTLPHIEFSLYKNSFVHTCLFAMINHCFMTMYDTLRTFHVLFVYFIFAALLFTVHLCAIDTRFNKCNLLTYLLIGVNVNPPKWTFSGDYILAPRGAGPCNFYTC